MPDKKNAHRNLAAQEERTRIPTSLETSKHHKLLLLYIYVVGILVDERRAIWSHCACNHLGASTLG